MAAAVWVPVFWAASASVRLGASLARWCQEATSATPASTATAVATAAMRRRRRVRGRDVIKAAFPRAPLGLRVVAGHVDRDDLARAGGGHRAADAVDDR